MGLRRQPLDREQWIWGWCVPELQFRGKEFAYNHHLTVPFRPLEMHANKGIGDARLDGNLIVHGTLSDPVHGG